VATSTCVKKGIGPCQPAYSGIGGKATRLPAGSKQEEVDSMVRKYDRHGNPYHEPPYTAAEEMELYRSMSGVVAYTRVVKAAPAVSQKSDDAVTPKR